MLSYIKVEVDIMLRVLHLSTAHFAGGPYEVCLLVDGRQYTYTLKYEVQVRKVMSLLKKGFKGLALNYAKKNDTSIKQGGA
jgi:hypothetical protein